MSVSRGIHHHAVLSGTMVRVDSDCDAVMFGRKRAPVASSAADVLRGLLYGDAPLEAFAGVEEFAAVRDALTVGDTASAKGRLRAIVADPEGGSREHLQAWHELRRLGQAPDDPTQLYGVVVDMALGGDLETLGAYADGTCRYLHRSGKALIWETQDEQVDAAVQALLAAGREVVARIGPWEGVRPPARPGNTRLSMLCAGGLYFGEGPAAVLESDPLGAAVLKSATSLLVLLTDKATA